MKRDKDIDVVARLADQDLLHRPGKEPIVVGNTAFYTVPPRDRRGVLDHLANLAPLPAEADRGIVMAARTVSPPCDMGDIQLDDVVDSLDRLNEVVGTDGDDAVHSSVALEEGISPLIESDDDSSAENTGTDTVSAVTDDDWLEPDASDSRAVDTTVSDDDTEFHTTRRAGDSTPDRPVGAGDAGQGAHSARAADIETLERRVRELTRAVERQSELLDRQAERLAELAERIDAE